MKRCFLLVILLAGCDVPKSNAQLHELVSAAEGAGIYDARKTIGEDSVSGYKIIDGVATSAEFLYVKTSEGYKFYQIKRPVMDYHWWYGAIPAKEQDND